MPTNPIGFFVWIAHDRAKGLYGSIHHPLLIGLSRHDFLNAHQPCPIAKFGNLWLSPFVLGRVRAAATNHFDLSKISETLGIELVRLRSDLLNQRRDAGNG